MEEPSSSLPSSRGDVFEKIAWWMDNAIAVPGTRMRVGIDAIVGLIPGVGDVLITFIQAAFVFIAVALNPELPKTILLRMTLNVAIDCLVGAIPLFGDVFDAFFKANTRNLKLLDKARAEYQRRGHVRAWPHVIYVVVVFALLIVMMTALGVGVFFALRWAWHSAWPGR